MKKCLSLVLAIVLMLCLIPSTAVFAAKENFIKITEVTVNEVYAPAAGTEVQFSANTTTKYVAINSVKWYEKTSESASGTALANGAKFKPGYYYTVSVETKISNNAYYFAGNGSGVAATINGKDADVVTDNSAQVIVIERTFPMCLATVSKFDFNLAAPTAGAAPHYPLLSGTGYESNNRGNNGAAYKNGIYWRNETDNKVLYPDENPKFEAGKKYSANITVATTTGYRVASSYTVTVNGKTVTSTKVDNECITFKVEFTVPKAHTHTPSAWKSDSANHWKICTDTSCGAVTTSNEAHKDANKDNKCDVCSYAIPKNSDAVVNTPDSSKPSDTTPTTPETEDEKTETDTPEVSEPEINETEATDTDADEKDDSSKESNTTKDKEKGNNAWIWIVLAIVVVLAAGGAVTFIIIKKKKAE